VREAEVEVKVERRPSAKDCNEQVLLTRLICEPGDVEGEQAVIAGTEVV
jgi:hypothetical protein